MKIQDEVARITYAQEDVRAFVDEQHRLMAGNRTAFAMNERNLWTYPVASVILGAAIFAAGMAFGKLVWP